MSENEITGPWEWDGKYTVGIPTEEGVYYFRVVAPNLACLIAVSPELVRALEEVTDWLEGSEVYATSHGAHTAAVEARKLIAKARGE